MPMKTLGLFLFAVLLCARAQASCTFTSSSLTLGQAPNTISTRQLYDGSASPPQSQVSSGFGCTGVINLLVSQTIKATLQSSSNGLRLRRVGGGELIPYQLFPTSAYGTPLGVGQTWDFSTTDVLGLLSGPGGTLLLYVRVPVGGLDIPQGTYQDTVTFTWDVDVCAVGALTCLVPSYRGTGTSTVTVLLEVQKACSVSASNVNLGSIALLSQPSTQQGAVYVSCSLGEGYQLGFDNGDHANGSQRRFYNATTNQFISYQILKTDNTEWHNTWGSGDVVSALGAGHSGGGASHLFNVRINTGQTTPAPAIYTDRVRVQVYF